MAFEVITVMDVLHKANGFQPSLDLWGTSTGLGSQADQVESMAAFMWFRGGRPRRRDSHGQSGLEGRQLLADRQLRGRPGGTGDRDGHRRLLTGWPHLAYARLRPHGRDGHTQRILYDDQNDQVGLHGEQYSHATDEPRGGARWGTLRGARSVVLTISTSNPRTSPSSSPMRPPNPCGSKIQGRQRRLRRSRRPALDGLGLHRRRAQAAADHPL